LFIKALFRYYFTPLPANSSVQSAIICHEILSTALFSTSQTSKMHCSTTIDRRIISQPRYIVVVRYQKQDTFVKSPKHNWNNCFYTYSWKAAQAFSNC